MVEREDVGSWLSGPPVGGGTGAPRGSRLGLPPQGRGSLAGMGRRIGALIVDWLACQAIAYAFFDNHPLVPLAIFAVENLLLVGTMGATVGHVLFGIRVRRLVAPRSLLAGAEAAHDPGPDLPPGPLRALIRTVLLCLVIPAVVWDGDGRGLHDRLAGTAIVRR
ncbi:RDD family protein [Cellulomonas denverensis]|uniref:RDD family protein n=1 Tax=Cellulomonas denverensis TaxID=264297 RepID=A0A7X6KWB3_9CELL|nr:RDD family protein [Cellulomonas denverensis]NKY23233.1 RDD family protein [Cellulomonas denverensis]GIG26351.1 RDD family protein [Cellulomonas denverensis]